MQHKTRNLEGKKNKTTKRPKRGNLPCQTTANEGKKKKNVQDGVKLRPERRIANVQNDFKLQQRK